MSKDATAIKVATVRTRKYAAEITSPVLRRRSINKSDRNANICMPIANFDTGANVREPDGQEYGVADDEQVKRTGRATGKIAAPVCTRKEADDREPIRGHQLIQRAQIRQRVIAQQRQQRAGNERDRAGQRQGRIGLGILNNACTLRRRAARYPWLIRLVTCRSCARSRFRSHQVQ